MNISIGDHIIYIDSIDIDLFEEYHWYVHKQKSNDIYLCKKKSPHYFHSYVAEKMGIESKFIDHIDGNGLNNQRSNLRSCNHSLNAMNSKKRPNTTSVYKGVSKLSGGKWKAQIELNQKSLYLGSFITEEEAALAYNQKAKELFGEYARLNDF